MHRGYVKLWRKTIDSRIFKDANLLKVWIWCLMKANHKGQWVKIETGKGSVEAYIKPGQFVFGRDSAAISLNMKPSSVRNRMNKLKTAHNINIEADRQYSIVSIINWDVYQPSTEKQDSDVDSDVDNQRTGKGQPKDTNNNDNNVKNVKTKNIYPEDFESFWKAYPNKRSGKPEAFKSWLKSNGNRPTINDLLKAVEYQKNSKSWQEHNGQYIPMATTWLNQCRWDAVMEIEKSNQSTGPKILTGEDLERMNQRDAY